MSRDDLLSLTTEWDRQESMMWGRRLADLDRDELASSLIWVMRDQLRERANIADIAAWKRQVA